MCSGDAIAEVNITIRLDIKVNNKNIQRDDGDILDVESIKNNDGMVVDYEKEITHSTEIRNKRSDNVGFNNHKSALRGDAWDKISRREHDIIDQSLVKGYPNKHGVLSLVFRRKKICLKTMDENISSNMVSSIS